MPSSGDTEKGIRSRSVRRGTDRTRRPVYADPITFWHWLSATVLLAALIAGVKRNRIRTRTMLEVTTETRAYLATALERRQAPENISMRLSRRKGGLQIAPDQERPGDRGFDLDDRTILLVSESLAGELDGQRLCVESSPSGHVEVRLERS